MTVSSTTSRKTYLGDAVTTSFDTNPVAFFLTSDLLVYVVVTATGVATLLTENTHYTVSGGSGTTGTVSLAGGSSPYGALSALQTLVIVRAVPETQLVDFVNNEATDAEVAEDALDKLTMICQQLDASVGRAFALASTDVSGASTVIPTPSANKVIGWNSAGTALQNYAGSDISLTLVSTFISTLIDDLTAAAARTTLGAAASVITTKGDLYVGGAAGAEARKAVGADGYNLRPSSAAADGLAWAGQGFQLWNGTLSASQNGTVLTIAVKTHSGADPSDTDPVFVTFRSATASSGAVTTLKINAATSISTTVGGTFGLANSQPFHLWAVGFNDGGTFRLALINCLSGTVGGGFSVFPLAQFGIASATQIGAGSTSAGVFYSAGAAVASKAYTPLGYLSYEGGLATAGTFAADQTRTDLFRAGMPLPGMQVGLFRANVSANATGATAIPFDNTIPQSTEGDQFATVTYSATSAANLAEISFGGLNSNSTARVTNIFALFQDAGANALAVAISSAEATASDSSGMHYGIYTGQMGVSGSTAFKMRCGNAGGSTTTFAGIAATSYMGGTLVNGINGKEIMV